MGVASGGELYAQLEVFGLALQIGGGGEVGGEPRGDLAHAPTERDFQSLADARVQQPPAARREVVAEQLLVGDVGEAVAVGHTAVGPGDVARRADEMAG